MQSGVLTLVAIGGFVAWRNRAQLQRLFESSGISSFFRKQELGNVLQSGLSRISDVVRSKKEETINQFPKAV
jgi:hypothetical protein